MQSTPEGLPASILEGLVLELTLIMYDTASPMAQSQWDNNQARLSPHPLDLHSQLVFTSLSDTESLCSHLFLLRLFMGLCDPSPLSLISFSSHFLLSFCSL